MQSKVAVITTVRDDDFFLKKWVDYYGGFFGKEALYVINHGNQNAVKNIAAGCNLIPIPATDTLNFNMRRWRTQNGLLGALRQWYDHVIVCDVDEFIVVDPASGFDLGTWLDQASTGTVRTAFGLEVVHLVEQENDSVENTILGPRRHAKISSWYSKPCVISRAAKLSRGGHYATYRKLNAPEFLYLFHMKYCDIALFTDTLDRRNAMVRDMGVKDVKETTTNSQWFAINRDDAAEFKAYAERKVDESWDFSKYRKAMQKTFQRRQGELFHFKRQNSQKLFKLPDRFSGIV